MCLCMRVYFCCVISLCKTFLVAPNEAKVIFIPISGRFTWSLYLFFKKT